MANKFTKSVLERQAKELRQQQREGRETSVPSEPLYEEPVTEAPARVEGMPPLPEVASHVAAAPEPMEAPAQPASFPALGDYIIRSEERRAKNKTFYLDASVIDALKRAAVEQQVTESKLVNDILKRLLGV